MKVWFGPRFLLVMVVGTIIAGVVDIIGDLGEQIALLSLMISILAGVGVEIVEHLRAYEAAIARAQPMIEKSRQISQDSSMAHRYHQIVNGIIGSQGITHQLFRELAIDYLELVGNRTEALGQGQVEFRETEAWRVAYDKILSHGDVMSYRSIAWVTSNGYWQDEPGQSSTELNYRLQYNKRLQIERIAILADNVWRPGEKFPEDPIHQWLIEQYNHGIWVELVRESSIVDEPELLADVGIYGNIAVGKQFIDRESRTTRFILSFDPREIEAAVDHWEKLKLFSVSLQKLLDQK